MSTEPQCPFGHGSNAGTSNRDWWPNQLRLELLNQHSSRSNPLGEQFNSETQQAMNTVPTTEHAPGTVVMVMQKGYVLNGRLLRPALVSVAKEPE